MKLIGNPAMPQSSKKQKHFSNQMGSALNYDCHQLQHWLLHTPMGREILRKERFFLHNNVPSIFGLNSLQIGLGEINLLQGNKIPNHYTINIDIKADLRFIPFATNSIDLIVCPHVLEFTNNYHHVLQEFHRILSPQGKLIITAFNRHSWFGIFKSRIDILKNARLIKLGQLKDQLQTLNFHLEGGKFFSYTPPFKEAKKIYKYRWMNKAGDRWFPTLANSFAIIASKEVITPTLIKRMDREAFKIPEAATLGTAKICNKN